MWLINVFLNYISEVYNFKQIQYENIQVILKNKQNDIFI